MQVLLCSNIFVHSLYIQSEFGTFQMDAMEQQYDEAGTGMDLQKIFYPDITLSPSQLEEPFCLHKNTYLQCNYH